MCLAVPMEVIRTDGVQGDFLTPPIAEVESQGTRATVRLDIVDRMPQAGDYVIVHAGFAIHTLTKQDAAKSLTLLNDMAKKA